MIRSHLVTCWLVLLVALPVAAAGQTTPAPGVSEGQKIGTMVKTAISTAAPGISSILTLIDQLFANRTKAGSNKATAPELKEAANSKPVQATVNKTVTDAQKAIQPVGRVSDELGVIGRFLGPSVTATEFLIVIRTKLTEHTTDWVGISNAWEKAKIQIGNLKSVSDTDLNKVRDGYFRIKLGAIRSANDTTVVSISQDVAQKNLSDLKGDLATLLSTLADMTAVAGYEVAELQADIGDLANWAKGGMAGSPSIPRSGPYQKFLDAHLPSR